MLDARAQFQQGLPATTSPASLVNLYDLLTMPPVPIKAHQKLDDAVDAAYAPLPGATALLRLSSGKPAAFSLLPYFL